MPLNKEIRPNYIYQIYLILGDACGVTIIALRNGHGKMNSKPGQGCLHFT